MVTEERVANLETALTKFIEQSGLIVAAIHEDVAEMRAHSARTDRKLIEMQQQGEKARQEFERRWVEAQQREGKASEEFNRRWVESHEESNRRWAEAQQREEKASEESNRRWVELHEESNRRWAEAHEESNRRWAEWQQRADKDRKDFNKRLAEISDSMGTLIEDMVAPCGFNLANAIFSTEEAQTNTIRVKRKHPANPGEMMELDLLAIGPTKVLVVEVKRRMDAAKAAEYRQKLARLPEFFPELAGKVVYPAVASVYLEPSVVAFLNREKIHGIAMGDEVMEVVNLGQF